MKKIFVGNLDSVTTEQDLRNLFEPLGQIDSVSVIKDKFSGQPRGFAFVEMPNDEEGERAIAELNGRHFGSRDLTVNEARPREERPPRSGRFGGGSGRGGLDRGSRSDRGGSRRW